MPRCKQAWGFSSLHSGIVHLVSVRDEVLCNSAVKGDPQALEYTFQNTMFMTTRPIHVLVFDACLAALLSVCLQWMLLTFSASRSRSVGKFRQFPLEITGHTGRRRRLRSTLSQQQQCTQDDSREDMRHNSGQATIQDISWVTVHIAMCRSVCASIRLLAKPVGYALFWYSARTRPHTLADTH